MKKWAFEFLNGPIEITQEIINKYTKNPKKYDGIFETGTDENLRFSNRNPVTEKFADLFGEIADNLVDKFVSRNVVFRRNTTSEKIMNKFNLPISILFTDGENKICFMVELRVEDIVQYMRRV